MGEIERAIALRTTLSWGNVTEAVTRGKVTCKCCSGNVFSLCACSGLQLPTEAMRSPETVLTFLFELESELFRVFQLKNDPEINQSYQIFQQTTSSSLVNVEFVFQLPPLPLWLI